MCMFPWWPVRWIALCSCLPEMVWFIPVWDYRLQFWRKAGASPLISTMCVSCQWWQMTCPSTLCHPAQETHRQSEYNSEPQLAERVLGGWRHWWWWWWWWVCVCVFLLVFSLQETRSGDISLLLCTSVSSQMNWLFMGVREDSLVEGSHDWTCGDGEKHYSSAILELMNIILASVHVQGEGDMSLVLAFLPVTST